MAFKEVLLHLDERRGHESRLRLAADLARRQQGHLVGLYGVEPLDLARFGAPAGSSYVEFEAVQALEARYREGARAAAARVEAAFRSAAERAGISAEWRMVEGEIAAVATLHARYADIAVLGQIDPDNVPAGSAARLPESVLLGSGRPVLLVPYAGRFEAVGETVLVAWNATREAARAVQDALPLLEQAEQVTVLAVNPAPGIGGEGDLPAADMAHYLARHGVKAEASYTVAGDIDVSDLILSRAADLGSDLIVMGGYGHSRIREFVLGGVTRSLLQHMTVPVLLSH